MVVDVFPGSPAQAAGMEPGDVITRINGHPVTDPSDVTSALAGGTRAIELQLQFQGSGDDVLGQRPVGDSARRVPMSFLHPASAGRADRDPFAVVWYVGQQRRRAKAAAAFAAPALTASVDAAPPAAGAGTSRCWRSGWRSPC